MFKNISQKIGKFFIWTLVVLITLSFAVWGIGDIFRGNYDTSVAKVGDKKIGLEEFNEALRTESNKMRSYFGGSITDEQIKQMRLDFVVLNNLINQSLLNQEAAKLGLKVSDDVAIKLISMNSMFQDESGKFSREAFAGFLQNNRKSESEYLNYIREQLALSTIVDSAISVKVIPKNLVENLYLARNEQREVSLLIVPAGDAKDIGQPTEANISEFYDKNKENFAAPEVRGITLASINVEEQKKNFKISDEQVKNEYEARKKAFTPETAYDIYNVVVADEAKAKEVQAAISGGKDVLKAAKEIAKSDSDVEIKGVILKEMPKEIADFIKNAKSGDLSNPIKTSFGFHVIKLKSVTESKFPEFSELKKAIHSELEDGGFGNYITKLITQFQDDVASGTAFDEAAKKLSIKTEKFEGLTKGEMSKDFENKPEIFKAAFATEQGTESEVIQSATGKFLYIVMVDSVKPERIRALDEVRGLVETKWKEEKRDEAARKKAEEIVKKIKESKGALSLEAAAKNNGFSLKTNEVFKRSSQTSYPMALVEEIFNLKTGQITDSFMDEKGNYIIASPEKIIPANLASGKERISQIKEDLEARYTNDIMSSYIAYLRSKYAVHVNENRISSGS